METRVNFPSLKRGIIIIVIELNPVEIKIKTKFYIVRKEIKIINNYSYCYLHKRKRCLTSNDLNYDETLPRHSTPYILSRLYQEQKISSYTYIVPGSTDWSLSTSSSESGSWLHRSLRPWPLTLQVQRVTLTDPSTVLDTFHSFTSYHTAGWTLGVTHRWGSVPFVTH